ncbi:MAG: hypothetical protein OD918_09240 [Gammaproteobacteria bacterium]
MNDKTDKYMQRANESLAFLRQKVEAVRVTVENISSLAELPEAKSKSVEAQLWAIFAYGEYYVEKVIHDLGTQMRSTKGKNFDFYYNEYQPFIEKTKGLIDVSGLPTRQKIEIQIARALIDYDAALQSDINGHMPAYERLARNGWVRDVLLIDHKYNQEMKELLLPLEEAADGSLHASIVGQPLSGNKESLNKYFGRVMDFARRFVEEFHSIREDDDEYDDMVEHVSDIENLQYEKYFNPDEWVANRKDLSPIIVARDLKKIPVHIRARVEEIYHSYIFGNWMSAIAMSRCLLEYAIVDETSLLKIENLYDEKRQLRPLVDLIADVKEPHTELVPSMTHIRKAGNSVMHPPRPRGHPLADLLLLPPNKHAAQKCVEGIVKIITVLYGVQPWPQKPHYRPR